MKTMTPTKDKLETQEGKALLTFLKRVREGEYAEIAKTTLNYPRIPEQREEYEELYYYSIE